MTRYTSIGRKRTYLEAGFGEKQRTADDVETETITTDRVNQPPPAKKRKRMKHKGTKPDEASVRNRELENGESPIGEKEKKNEFVSKKKAPQKKDYPRKDKSEKRRIARIKEKLVNTTCFACREKGHAAKECPKMKTDDMPEKDYARPNAVICYRCGSKKHTLSRCKQPEDPENPLPFASCFVCSGKGHLASSCPQNKEKGVYPNGGSCKLCGETSHLARNCPTRKQDKSGQSLLVVGMGRNTGADEDEFHSFKRLNAEIDVEERKESKAKRMADIKMGVVTKTVKSFASTPPAAAKKKVVVF